jgi:dihydroxy-acid dehydratase
MKEILPLLNGDCITANGKTIAENVGNAECHSREVIRALDTPLFAEGGTAVLSGNLCPNGAVIKQSAASPELLQHRGRALVFDNYEIMKQQVEDPDLPIGKDSVLVMKNAGPIGGPGFPEWGHMPMPKALLAKGIADVVRISDARMSGTSFGTVVLHISPESAIGGPLAAVETGDEIILDVPNRRLELNIPAEELARRLAAFMPPEPHYKRGYGKLFLDHVTQAHLGCDFDFLAP